MDEGSHNWAAKNLIGNWRIVGTYTAETGELVTPQSGTDANHNGDAVDRTIRQSRRQANIGSNVTALKNTRGDTVAYLATNPNARYIRAQAGQFATAGRNTLKDAGHQQLGYVARQAVPDHRIEVVRDPR